MRSSHSSFPSYHLYKKTGFSLIELLVVIAIIAILSVVVILTLNPAELLRQSRDSSRLSDMATLNSALGIYAEDTGSSMGTPSTTYISIPDPAAGNPNACPNLVLPAQSTSTGWGYQCPSSSSPRMVNGNGWIPLNLAIIASGAPVGSLPQDPINQTSTNLFYTYTTDGKLYEVTSVMESSKYRSQLSTNPSQTMYPGVIALGTNLSLSGLWNPNGLVGYWNFEEGSGSTTIDQSGNGNSGNWTGTPAGNGGTYYTGGKVGSYAGYFNGTSDYVSTLPAPSVLVNIGSFSLWFETSQVTTAYLLGVATSTDASNYVILYQAAGKMSFAVGISGSNYLDVAPQSTADNNWHYLVATWNHVGENLFIDGQLQVSHVINRDVNLSSGVSALIGERDTQTSYFKGNIDDLRIYNRVLSAAEIQAIYAAER